MNIYLKEQLLIHASHSAKTVMKHKGHSLKKSMPRNVTKKNALRIARLRNKDTHKTFVKDLKELAAEKTAQNRELQEELILAQHELRHYHKQYGVEHPVKLHVKTRKRLQEIIHLQDELVDQRLQAKELLHEKKITHDDYESLVKRLSVHQEALRKKKKKILLG